MKNRWALPVALAFLLIAGGCFASPASTHPEEGVRAALDAFTRAYVTKDADLLSSALADTIAREQLYTAPGRQDAHDTFTMTKDMWLRQARQAWAERDYTDVQLLDAILTARGDRATATGTWSLAWEEAGAQSCSAYPATFGLHRTASSRWVIDSMAFGFGTDDCASD